MKKQLLFLVLILLISTGISRGQGRVITGTVTSSEDKQPLPGVSVKIKGTNTGTQTNAEGRYSIPLPATGGTLTFTYIGFTTRDVAVGAGNVINVVLESSTRTLGEVVVTALGISRERRTVGYATTQVKSEEINKAAPTNIVTGLQGKVAGVSISQTSGQPGGSSKVILRGYTSIAGNNQPLFVIDGVPVNNSRVGIPNAGPTLGPHSTDTEENFDFGNNANEINPNDIESVNILKGAAATSLYGSRASNGVILITTKKGQAGKLKVDFTSNASFTQVALIPKLQKSFGQGWDATFILSENGSWGPRLDGQNRVWGAPVNNSQLLKPFKFQENNFRDAFELGGEYNNSIAVSGGTEASTFYLSYGNVSSDGYLPSNKDVYNRNTITLTGSTKNKWFNATATVNYVGRNSKTVFQGQANSGIGGSFYEDILQIPVDIPIKDLEDYKNIFFNVDNFFTPFAENPYFSLYENGSTLKSDRVYGNINLNFKANNWLTFQVQQGMDVTQAGNRVWSQKNAPSPGSWNDGANVEGAQRQADVGNVTEASQRFFEYDTKVNALINHKITSDFDINGILGANFNDRGSRQVATGVENLAIPGFFNIFNSPNRPTSDYFQNERRLFGAYASATLGYASWAYLTLNARNDWSSTLPSNNRSYFYPGANLSLLLSEKFDLSKTPISLFKVRAAWGRTGNDTDPYRIFNTLITTNIVSGFGNLTMPFNGVAGYSLANRLNNANLKPEISTESEVGGEMQLFKNRLGFDLSYYYRVTKDQILPVPTSPSSGYTSYIVNFGKIRNQGIELNVNGSPVKGNVFGWDMRYVFSHNDNKVLELPQGLNQVTLVDVYDVQFLARKGQPLGVFEAPVARTDPQGRTIVNSQGFPVPTTVNAYYGTSQAKFNMGLTNNFRFKDFTLGFTVDWRKGGIFYSGTADLLNFVGNTIQTTYNDRKPFIVPNSVQEETAADGTVNYVENKTPISEVNVDDYFYHTTNSATIYHQLLLDRSFIKLREANLTYNLPRSFATRIKANSASISVFGRNLVTWLPKSNTYIDPEVSNFGNDLNSEFGEFRTGPSTRVFGASLRVSF